MKKEYNRVKYTRVQRLISLRIAEAYLTISREALCIITGITPINLKVEEAVALYNITTGRINQRYLIDKKRTQFTGYNLGTQLKLMTTLTI